MNNEVWAEENEIKHEQYEMLTERNEMKHKNEM